MSPIFLTANLNRISKGIKVGKATPPNKGEGAAAFTLIELLVVIAIIGLLAGIVLTLSGVSTANMRKSRVKAELNGLLADIENYKATLGNYPPDNQDTSLSNADPQQYHRRCGLNPLFYELSGCTFEKGIFTTQNKADTVTAVELKNALGVKGVDNSARNKKDIPWRGRGFKQGQFADIDGFTDVDILIVPIDKGPHLITAKGGTKKLNPWFYDASSTNRHNMETFDLWAEYTGRDGKTITIGNWQE
jgi:prepilin-type N-terminal cleavage/methylation domain-containing protein